MLVVPPALRPGDLIAVVAPSGPLPLGDFWRGLAWLRDRYRIRMTSRVLERKGFLAGDDDRRLVELMGAFQAPEVRAVVAGRGGYGAMRLLSHIDFSRTAPRWLVGFSDITALHLEAARAGVASVHGPNVTGLGQTSPMNRAAWLAAVERPGDGAVWADLLVVRRGSARGRLFGGNLALLEAMAAAGRLDVPAGSVLVIEDVDERSYRIDRMLTSLRLGGHLSRVAAVVVGGFTRCPTGPDGVSALMVLEERLGDLGVPVLAGAPFGHGEDNRAFVLGREAEVDGGKGEVRLLPVTSAAPAKSGRASVDSGRLGGRMPSLSPLRAALRPSVFADLQPHIDAFASRGGELISLHLGDTYLEPPKAAQLGAVVQAHGDDRDLYRYGSVAGLPSLRDAIAEDVRRRGRAFPGALGEPNVLLGIGATHALFCAATAVLSPGDEVLLAAPYWPLAHGILLSAGARPVEVPFTSVLHEQPDADPVALLRAALTPQTKAVYLITPNNPDGKMLSRAELEAIAAFAVEEDLWVFADEAYADFSFKPEHLSIASFPGMADRTITAYSFSKSHALAGLRVGYVVAPEPVVRVGRRVSTHSGFNVPVAMQHAAAAALASGPRWTERALLLYRRSLEAVVDGFAGTKVRFPMPDGGAYVFLDLREVLGDRPLSALLERAVGKGVLVAPGAGFGSMYPQHARLCFTSEPLPRLVEGLARFVAAIDEL